MTTPLRIALGLVLFGAGSVAANTTPQVNLSQDWSNAGLITINDDWSQVPGIMGRLGDGLTNSGGVDPQTVTADQPTVDVIANQSSPNTLMPGGVAEFDGIADRVVALQGSGSADAPFLLLTLDTSGQSSVTISYKLRDIDGSSDNALTPVALQYRIGATGDFTNIPAGFVADATTGPNLAGLVTPVSVLLPAALNNQPTVQLRIITTNAVSIDEWVGIDDIQVTAGPSCFTDITAGLPALRASRVAWGDYDNDADMDLLVSGDIGGSVVTRVYRSSGGLNPVFHDITVGLPGLIGPEVAWVDYDVDGDLDIFLSGATADSNLTRIYRNNGIPNPTFTEVPAGLTGVSFGGAAWGDYDNDGDPDLLQTGQSGRAQPYVTRLYRNDRGAVPAFTIVPTDLPAAREGDVAWGDYDNDGDLDILMTGITDPNTVSLVHRNDGNGAFTDIGASETDNSGVAVDWGDFDADGDLDALVGRQNDIEVLTNQEVGMVHSFAAVLPPVTPGVMQGTTTWGDYDNDGRLDFLSTGFDYWAFRPATNLFRQVPASPYFEYVGTGMPGIGDDPTSDGLASGQWGDVDGDLDLDVVLAGGAFTGVPTTRVYRNGCGANTRPTEPTGLSVTVVGLRATFSWSAATDAETPAAGLSYNLRVGTAPGVGDIVSPLALATGRRTVPALGNAMQNLSWTIDLPAPGTIWWSVQSIDGAYVGSPFATEQSLCVSGFADVASGVTGTAGGASAWGDYDNDGDLDLVVSGTPDGSSYFTEVYRYDGVFGQPLYNTVNAVLPGTVYGAAAWGDMDNDGDLDLALSGITSSGPITRVYRQSSGLFVDIGAGLPGTYFGSLAWGDYDNDGDLDLVMTGNDGTVGISRIYRSSGGANPAFTDAAAGLIGLTYGAVSLCDFDVDGDLDILMTGSTAGGASNAMLYRNSGGANPTFAGVPTGITGVINGSHAWGDYDADGDPDLVVCGEATGGVKVARLWRNPGGPTPTFGVAVANFTGVASGQVAFGDHDNDGDLDVLVAGNDGTGASGRIYDNGGGANPAFTPSPDPLPGVYYGTAAFGDVDRDHDLDIVMSGLPGPPYGTRVLLDTCRPSNAPPQPPSNLTVSMVGNRATFSWTAATDNNTPSPGLTYNLRVGSTSGGSEIVSPMAMPTSGLRRIAAIGNAGQRTSRTIDLPGTGPWYWSVQAIDAAYEGSPFATEQAIAQSGVGAEATSAATRLWSAGPNPFAGTAMLAFSVAAKGPVTVTIVDAAGRFVRRLVDEELDAGRFERAWDGRDAAGVERASGLYFARLRSGNESRVLRLLLVR